MGSQLSKFWKGPAIDRVLAVLAMTGIAGWIALFGQIIDMSVNYPLPLALVSGVSFLLGVGVAYLLGWRDARVKKDEYERRRAEEAERIEAECAQTKKKLDFALCKEFRETSYQARLYLYEIYRLDEPLELKDTEDLEEDAVMAELYDSHFVEHEDTYDGTRFEMSHAIREFLDSHPELCAYIASEWERLNQFSKLSISER